MMRLPRTQPLGLVSLSLFACACVEPFGGSNVQITFSASVPGPAPPGIDPPFGTPPADTYLTLYGVRYVYERDPGGAIVVDENNEPVIADSYVFRIYDFEIRPLVDLDSPCFIEVDNTRFPGLHVTKLSAKIREATGVADPLQPPPDAAASAITDVLNADRRVGNLRDLQNQVKAVTSASNARRPEAGTTCVEDGGAADQIPPIDCMGDASNQVRLSMCRQFWRQNPSYYEGNDKIFMLPLGGSWYGAVEGLNPINNSAIGGAGFFVPAALTNLDSLLINWQFKDANGDGEPDYPPAYQDRDKSDIGYLFMQGSPRRQARGVLHVPMVHPDVPAINAEAVIFRDLDRDDVNF